jgi:hypothetical protein
MTTVPRPLDLANGYTLVYEAWIRLVEVKIGSASIQKNQYDGLNRRTVRSTPIATTDRIHYYYNENWQVVE